MSQLPKFYRCGQCSRLDSGEGTLVTVVNHMQSYDNITYTTGPSGPRASYSYDEEHEVRLCDDCYKEIIPPYGS